DDTWDRSIGRTWAVWIIFVLGPMSLALPAYFTHVDNPFFDAFGRDVIERYLRQPKIDFRADSGTLIQGDPSAPIEIVQFADFQCPNCRIFNGQLKEILKGYSGQYRLIYKHYPFNEACNSAVQGSIYQFPHSCRIAEMTQALGAMGKFWDVKDAFYDLQDAEELDAALEEIASAANVDYMKWIGVMNNPLTKEQVRRDIEEGMRLGINKIPAVYINGRYLHNLNPDHVERILRTIVRKQDE
ncbi:thioredoxin domain-containing protein, partial [Candidatus Sumerlaeota bacterium]|nr:thioredoxin domain-containing protein [Candidatus Sumerlaeota bacterium]